MATSSAPEKGDDEVSSPSSPRALVVVLDPVCGAELRPVDAFCGAEWEGERFLFCSDACRLRFERDPTRYCVSCVEVA